MRAHLEAGLDRVIDALSSAGVMDRRSATELERELAHASERAANATELSSAFRKSVVDLARTLEGPKLARQDRGVRRAIEHIRDHFDETLSLGRAARIAGFAPSYFSRLFAASERMTFREYVQRLRVERAKQMLTSTTLRSERVGQLCGFRSRQRFHAIFTRLTRVTPSEYRRRASLSSTYRYRSRAQP
jgi:transcriptional regulator GlxA family with amidase domain